MSIPCAFRPLGRDENIINSKSYVQDGLILHLDGIDNAGFGNHVSSLAQWVDLSGNGNHAGTNSGLALFNADSWQGNGSTYFNLPSSFFEEQRVSCRWTVEVVVLARENGNVPNQGIVGFGGNLDRQIYAFMTDRDYSFTNNQGRNYVYFDVSNQSLEPNKIDSFGYCYSYSRNLIDLTMTRNGNVIIRRTNQYTQSSSLIKYIGRIDGYLTFFGKLHTVRVYSRPLTESKISRNYEIDKIRFKLN